MLHQCNKVKGRHGDPHLQKDHNCFSFSMVILSQVIWFLKV